MFLLSMSTGSCVMIKSSELCKILVRLNKTDYFSDLYIYLYKTIIFKLILMNLIFGSLTGFVWFKIESAVC